MNKKYFLAWFLGGYTNTAFQLLTMLICVRLLTPYQLGQFAIAAVFAQILGTVREFGVGEYIIQSHPLSPLRIKTALTVSFLISWSFAMLLFGISFPVAWFYQDAELQTIVQIMSGSFLLIPFGAVKMALMQRHMQVKAYWLVQLIANLTTMLVTIACAYQGQGAKSMAIGAVSAVLAQNLTIALVSADKVPFALAFSNLREAIKFGFYTISMYLSTQLGRSIPDLLIGRVLGLEAVAFYARCNNVVEIYSRIITRNAVGAILPYFTKLQREQGHFFEAFLRSSSYITAVGWPLCLVLIFTCDSVIRVLFGTQWMSVVEPTRIILVATMIDSAYLLSREAMIAKGLIKEASVMQFQVVMLRLISLCFGVSAGLMGIAIAVLVGSVLVACLYAYTLHKHQIVQIRQVLLTARASVKMLCWTLTPLVVFLSEPKVFVAGEFLKMGVFYAFMAAWILWGYEVCQHPFGEETRALVRTVLRKLNIISA
ncbi:MAG: hypothetical protein RLZZ502_480 [Pseudomonadota bacterium]|jgi:O-antigen/teichoic acid export membrane protein